MAENTPTVFVEKIFSTACKLPYCKIDREAFLTKEFRNKISLDQLNDALENGTINAKIPLSILNEIAKGSIALETSKVTLISTAAGIPGGLAMIGTIPTDLAQFYAHVFRIVQKLAYLYGSKEIELSDGTQNVLMIYLGAMFGVSAASAALAKLAGNAAKIGTRVAAKPLTKYAIYNISKKILAWLGVKLTKDTVGKAISKTIPIVGGVISGGLSVATYLPMAKRLQKELKKYAEMTPDELIKANASADIILADFSEINDAESLNMERPF
ncbi:MAG: hypothetical protein LBB67_02295 [Oscillospiraceae bacterium]|jgi:hypothetical protein|nr:hypothetical protein [Oscillospiraceae bacterium]